MLPDAPALPPEPGDRLGPNAGTYWCASGVGMAVPLLLAAGYGIPELTSIDEVPGVVGALLWTAAVLACVYLVAVRPILLTRTWRYAILDEDVDIRHGALVVTRTLIPLVRVQHVDTQRTFFGDIFELATLRIHTAAGTHEIPCLTHGVASDLRATIAQRAHVPDEL